MDTAIIAVVLAAVLLTAALVLGRRRRQDALEPVRLGPSWSPSDDAPAEDPRDPAAVAARTDAVASETGTDAATVGKVLDVWDEYLGVIGLAPLAAGHRRLVYDPYDPPVVQRGPDGAAVPDPARVARDVARRLGIAETIAHEVLSAVRGHASVVAQPDQDARER